MIQFIIDDEDGGLPSILIFSQSINGPKRGVGGEQLILEKQKKNLGTFKACFITEIFANIEAGGFTRGQKKFTDISNPINFSM